jgi:hypothetical protein
MNDAERRERLARIVARGSSTLSKAEEAWARTACENLSHLEVDGKWIVQTPGFKPGDMPENVGDWLNAGMVIYLLTKEEFEELPDGTELVSVLGAERTKGVDKVDMDEFGGRIAWGVKP